MDSRLLPSLVYEILDGLKKDYEERRCREELFLTLNIFFRSTLKDALQLIDDGSVFLIKSDERCIFQIVGSRGHIYTIMETSNFCKCNFFKHQVLNDEALCCKHFLAAKVALMLGKFKTKNETPEGITSIMISAYSNQEL